MENQQGQALVKQALEEVPTITCEEFWSMETEDNRPHLIDVREQDEWDKGHIDWATHIPRGRLEMQVEQLFPNKNESVILCCAAGGRSALAGQTLIKMGYKDVKYLSGGFTGYCGKEDRPE